MNLDKELLEAALRNHGRNSTVDRVISMEAELALPKGENYLSVIYRVSLKVVLGNGRRAERNLIAKMLPPEKAEAELIQNLGVFKSETMMYTAVLREMEYLMEEFGDTEDPLWCKLYHYEPYSSLIFEDLKTSGFRMTRRQDCLDLEHTLLVLRSLGRFHAISKILEKRGIISKEDFKPYALVSDKNIIKYFVYYGTRAFTKEMEKNWGPEWYDVAQKLKIPCEVLQEKLIKMGEVDESKFNCLNHGDCWSNNMMFKYDWKNRPFTMRFVDFQMCHYNSCVWDVIHTINLCTTPDLRKLYYAQMKQAYIQSLLSTLRFYQYDGSVPDEKALHDELDRVRPYDILLGLFDRSLILSTAPFPLDLNTWIKSSGQEGLVDGAFMTEKLKEVVGPDLREIYESNFVDEVFYRS